MLIWHLDFRCKNKVFNGNIVASSLSSRMPHANHLHNEFTLCVHGFHHMVAVREIVCVLSRANMHSPNMWFHLIFAHCPIQPGKKCLESLCFVIFACWIRCGCVVVVLTDWLSLCLIWAPVEPGFKRVFIDIHLMLLHLSPIRFSFYNIKFNVGQGFTCFSKCSRGSTVRAGDRRSAF